MFHGRVLDEPAAFLNVKALLSAVADIVPFKSPINAGLTVVGEF